MASLAFLSSFPRKAPKASMAFLHTINESTFPIIEKLYDRAIGLPQVSPEMAYNAVALWFFLNSINPHCKFQRSMVHISEKPIFTVLIEEAKAAVDWLRDQESVLGPDQVDNLLRSTCKVLYTWSFKLSTLSCNKHEKWDSLSSDIKIFQSLCQDFKPTSIQELLRRSLQIPGVSPAMASKALALWVYLDIWYPHCNFQSSMVHGSKSVLFKALIQEAEIAVGHLMAQHPEFPVNRVDTDVGLLVATRIILENKNFTLLPFFAKKDYTRERLLLFVKICKKLCKDLPPRPEEDIGDVGDRSQRTLKIFFTICNRWKKTQAKWSSKQVKTSQGFWEDQILASDRS